MKKFSKILLVFVLFLTMMSNTYAYSRDENDKVVNLTAKTIISYALGFDTKGYLNDMKDVSIDDYEIWNKIVDYWNYIENDMIENKDIAPDGLPTNNHVFIVLGYALNEDGTMQDELIGRLNVALKSAKKYPNSYILVTGGVEKNGHTEGELMSKWLINQGIDENRIIVETKAPDTAGNASNSFEMLYTEYKGIKSCSLITSQYHLKRGSLLYYAESLLKAKELGVEPIEFIGNGNAGWVREDKVEESMFVKTYSLFSIAHCVSAVIGYFVKIVILLIVIIVLLIVWFVKRRKQRKSRFA